MPTHDGTKGAAQLREPLSAQDRELRTSSGPSASQSPASRERSTSSAAQKPPSTFLYACQICERPYEPMSVTWSVATASDRERTSPYCRGKRTSRLCLKGGRAQNPGEAADIGRHTHDGRSSGSSISLQARSPTKRELPAAVAALVQASSTGISAGADDGSLPSVVVSCD